MICELIIIGNEILSGRTRDSNGNYLANFLYEKQIALSHITVIQDDKETIIEAINSAKKRSQIVFTSGGLGPTKDDITKISIAKAFNQPLNPSESCSKLVEQHYLRIKRKWDSSLNHYHLFPDNFTPLHNPQGLAPGMYYHDQESDTHLFSAPGVPREFQEMVKEVIFPIIKEKKLLSTKKIVPYTIKTKNIPEEKIFGELMPTLWEDLSQLGQVSSLPNPFGVDIVIQLDVSENSYQFFDMELREYFEGSPIEKNIWQFGNKSLPEYIITHATTNHFTIVTAESCTGGEIANTITNISGSSSVFLGSMITYSNETKIKNLGVPELVLIEKGAVSEEVVQHMAELVKEKFEADFAISISGIAGPTGGTEDKPIGTAYIGISTPVDTKVFPVKLSGDRLTLKKRFTTAALHFLLQEMKLLEL